LSVASEEFTVVALPRSADPGRRFHVSLFITPSLTPDGADGRLRQFARFKRWPDALAAAEIALLGGTSADGSGGQVIPARALLDRLRPDVWPKVFPPTTPVRGRPQPQVPDELASYPASHIDRDALHVHTAALLQQPVNLPSPTGTGFDELVEIQLIGTRPPGLKGLDLERLLDLDSDLQARFSRVLDAIAAGKLDTERFSAVATAEGGFLEQLVDAHQAQAYYEQLAPPASTSVPSPPTPKPDFHERCTQLAGAARLLRWLGLVVDLHVDDLATLEGLRWIRGRIAIEGLAGEGDPARRPRTACYTRGTGFFARPETDDWGDGWLRLEHRDERFRVLDLDPDASALKLERHLRNLVRLAAAEKNGDAVNAAPPALRAAGFSIARRDRDAVLAAQLERAGERAGERAQGVDTAMSLEEINRGLRLEAWDDVSRAWHTLHSRRLEIEANGEKVADGVRDVGYVKGGALMQKVDEQGEPDANAPHQLHEVVVGWEGWSLSAPPPGKTIMDPEGDVGEPALEGAVRRPLVLRGQVEPGTLPRLRYGRSYAFRLVGVDLAGNSPPHELGVDAAPSNELLSAVAAALADRGAVAAEPSEFANELLARFREARPLAEPEALEQPRRISPAVPELTGVADLDRMILRRAGARAELRMAPGTTRLERIERAFDGALHETERLLAPTARVPDAAMLAGLIADLAGAVAAPGELEEALELYLDFVTKPRPFLRWDPVLPPTVVPRHAFSLGESLLTLVIRSGTEPDTGGVVVTAPDAYAASHPGSGYRATSERHLAAPKSSQRQAELHGMFDSAIASADKDARRNALAIALREAGTFEDMKIADLTKPGKLVAQSGVKTISGNEGQARYVVHDVDELVLPYLADPLAAGLSLTFPDAGRDHRLDFPWSVEGLRLDYRGRWPEEHPYRLILESGDELEGRVDGRAIHIALPPGTQLRLRSSSALRRGELDLLGLWRTRPDEYRDRDEIVEAAADGWLWWLTPFDEIRLVHAVQRPVEVATAVGLEPRALTPGQRRDADDPGCGLQGVIDLHGPSTGRIDLQASWSEPVDDPSADTWEEVTGGATPWGTDVEPAEDFLALLPQPFGGTVTTPDGDVVRLHQVRHEFGDTKHRVVDYTVRATTRFREHFDPTLGTEDLSLVGPTSRVSIPSSARPPKPVVRDVLPLFRWGERTEPEQPFGLRRTRRAGLRIYLERPWYATGEGELLGVVLGPVSGEAERGAVPVSAWAADPVWKQRGPSHREFLPLQDLLEAFEPELPDEPARPVLASGPMPVVDARGEPEVRVLGYRPEYSEERKLWFADVAFDQGPSFWPFVQLALARFQPESVDGKHLSPIVTCDFMQVTPDRIATLSRPDDRHVRVIVTGPVGYPCEIPKPMRIAGRGDFTSTEERVGQSRTVRARLEQRDGELAGSDLGWTTVAQTELALRGFSQWTASWLGTLELPRSLAPRRPGSRANWRVTVEEWERLRADPPLDAPRAFRSEARLVYADHLYL
jgi:hypothetical protein